MRLSISSVSLVRRTSPEMAQAVWKLKESKRDENDILGFGLKLESACVWAPKAALDE